MSCKKVLNGEIAFKNVRVEDRSKNGDHQTDCCAETETVLKCPHVVVL